jgi:hypothetical protein
MSAVPLHIQRRFEQRWASRFTAASNPPKALQQKPHVQAVDAPRGKNQRKTRQRELAGQDVMGSYGRSPR